MRYLDCRPRLLGSLLASAFILPACLSSGGDDSDGSGDGNNTPTISGNPPPAVVVGEAYSFTPSASDPDGDRLSFEVDNLPPWASFNGSTGAITGSPQPGDEGSYTGISISVSDGSLTTSLGPFTIDVTQSALGSITLSWNPPTQNEDGSPIENLAGYKIYRGTRSGVYVDSIRIDNPGITTYVIENLTPNTYYFAATSFNGQGVESSFSNEAVGVVTN